MKRSDVVLDIASVLIDEQLGFPNFKVAQEMANKIITKLEQSEAMVPAFSKDRYYMNGRNGYMWDLEDEA